MTTPLPTSVRRELTAALLLFGAAALAVAFATGWGGLYAARAVLGMVAAAALVAWGLRRAAAAAPHGPVLARFGPANRVTLGRLALALLLAAAIGEPLDGLPWLPWALFGVAAVAALLDAVDGPLARRSGRATAFGARFDMECDAWFTLVLSVLVWQLDRASPWVLASGAMRYAFVAATWGWPWLARPLPPSRRRQAVCVVQIVALVAALAPIGSREWSSALCLVGLAALVASFGTDIWRLARERGARAVSHAAGALHDAGAEHESREDGAQRELRDAAVLREPHDAGALRRVLGWVVRFAAAAFVLNTLLTFESRIDGVGVHWSPRLSFELCMGLLALMAWVAWRGLPSRRLSWTLAAACTMFVLARYVDVTVPAFFGRPVNLYWDGPHAWQLMLLAWATWPAWQVLGAVLAVATVLAAIVLASRWAVATLADGLLARPVRPWLAVGGALLGASFAAYPFVNADTRWFFSLPVTPTLARQVQLLGDALSRERSEARLTPSPAFAGNVGGLRGADVLLLFAESYGVSTFDRPAQAAALAAPRERLAHALARVGRHVVSARVRSPTFGGASWLAHAALLSGVDTHDPSDYDLLLTTRRPTLVSHFARHGYRTVGWMPGMQRPWPEGVFYGFERYADAQGVGYEGPAFGYWRIPDQASMALLHAQELAGPAAPAARLPAPAAAAAAMPATGSTARAARAPRFIVFPTLETHAPFHPLAPYQTPWEPLLTRAAYTPAQVAQALAPTGPPGGWTPAYVRAMAHTFEWLGDYLAERAPANLLTIVVGDHQPLAAVSGAGASWDVPVHVISRDEALLQRLRAAGFVSGLDPGPRSLGAMHELTGLLVQAFDAPRVDVAGAGARRQ